MQYTVYSQFTFDFSSDFIIIADLKARLWAEHGKSLGRLRFFNFNLLKREQYNV